MWLNLIGQRTGYAIQILYIYHELNILTMSLKFDDKGYLVPYKRIKIQFSEFEKFFIQSFSSDSSRVKVFENYKKFISDFSNQITPNFTHWIDGSFVTSKINPRDIDFTTLIQHNIYRSNRELIESNFRLDGAKENYNVDAYTIEILPQDHKKYSAFEIDLVYWDNWFSKTKKNWANKSLPKGYIEINFGSKE